MKRLAKRGQGIPASAKKKITFDKLVEKYSELREGDKPFENSDQYIVEGLSEYFKGRRLCEITPEEIERFRKARKDAPTKAGKARADGTVNRDLQILRAMLNKAVRWRLLDHNPFDEFRNGDRSDDSILFKVNSRDRFIEEDEIGNLLKACRPYLANIVMAAIFTGLRKSDVINLKWSNVNLEKGLFTYWERKKKKTVFKALNSDMIELLKRIPKGESDSIFLGAYGKPMKSSRNIHTPFKRALKKAGISDFHFHDLRHTSATHLVMRGASTNFVQSHLNHANPSMTAKYTHMSEVFQREQINLLNGICGEDGKKLVRNDQVREIEGQPGVIATA